MTDTSNLGLPCIEAAQAQKHVTHNEALRILDTLVQLAVVDRDLNAPPGSPSEGQRWIVKASPSPTDAWAGHGNQVAAWQDGGWQFSTPKMGWVAYVMDEGTLVTWNGTAWGDFFATVTAIQNLALLGVGTTADATNPVSAKLNNALWVAKTVAEGGDGNLRYKMSKESAAKTLSCLFQNNFSGRAEIGLTGDDDFHFKVSPDGSTWYEGIRIDRVTGKVSFPVNGGPREVLAANRTYYVRTDGSDSNNGLANTSGGAFLTIQKAIDVAASLDLSIYNVTIQVGNGTYTGGNVLKKLIGAGTVTIKGDSATPSNVVISTTSADCFTGTGVKGWVIDGFKLTTTTGGSCIRIYAQSYVQFKTIEFGALATSADYHLRAEQGSLLEAIGDYAISGGTGRHMAGIWFGAVEVVGRTVTLTGTPAFQYFAFASRLGAIRANGNTYSGSATGVRYSVDQLSQIFTNGGGANYFPGNTAGSADAATFGLYN